MTRWWLCEKQEADARRIRMCISGGCEGCTCPADETFPGKMKNMPAVFIHDCIAGCPGMGPRPLMPIEGKPMRKLGNVLKRSKMKPTNEDAEELQDLGGQLKKPPGPPKPGMEF